MVIRVGHAHRHTGRHTDHIVANFLMLRAAGVLIVNIDRNVPVADLHPRADDAIHREQRVLVFGEVDAVESDVERHVFPRFPLVGRRRRDA